jgi:Domain of unknown function (DUF5911)
VDRYPNISEHGLIGDLQTAALVTSDGTVDFFCCPRFDSPSVFASLLDAERGGYFSIKFMPVIEGAPADRHRLVRHLRAARGTMRFELDIQPRVRQLGQLKDFRPPKRVTTAARMAGPPLLHAIKTTS